MNVTRKTAAMGAWWLVSLLLVAWAAAPVRVEDDGGATPPQPVVENQVPSDFVPGLYDLSGNRVADSLEAYQAQQQAQIEAFQASHPDPGDGSGIHDAHGNFLGATLQEAAAAGNIQLGEPLDAVDPLRLRELHGEDKVYVDEKGQAFVYMKDGKAITAEEAAAEAERLGIEQKEFTRKWVNGAVEAERKKPRNLGESYTIRPVAPLPVTMRVSSP